MDDDGRISPRDARELTALWDEHAAAVFRHACFLTRGDRERAADLRQEAFVAAAKSWPTLRNLPPAKQKKWLRTTLQHKEQNDYSRREKEKTLLGQLVPLQQPRTQTPDAEQAAALEDMAVIIRTLPRQQYKIAVMRWSRAMKVREVANELGIAEGTVNSTLNAVRNKLADPLERYRKGIEGGEGEAS
jgi:RNA polymerase sigma factor (sigma-70 family)